MKKNFTINVDIEQQPSNSIFYLETTDVNSPFLTINVLESAISKNLTGTTCNLDIMKPDGTTTTVACTISNATSGVLTVTLPTTAINLPGQYKALVQITDTDASVVNTNSFVFVVQSGW
jgi:hypothetical protein